MSKENKNSTEKTRKELIKLIRKFNKSQSNYVAVGRHADNTDLVMIIDSWGADSLRHVLTIRPGGIYSTEETTFKINDKLLQFMGKAYKLVKAIDKANTYVTDIGHLDKIDLPDLYDQDDSYQIDLVSPKSKVEL